MRQAPGRKAGQRGMLPLPDLGQRHGLKQSKSVSTGHLNGPTARGPQKHLLEGVGRGPAVRAIWASRTNRRRSALRTPGGRSGNWK
jgi:hypothetical protein